MWRIEFTSGKFLPYLPEDCQSNPGAYGFELAEWLSRALMGRGVPTSYPLGEDWGWFIEYLDGETEITIGCSSEAGAGEGYRGSAMPWQIFLKQSLSLTQRLKGASAPPKVRDLADLVLEVLRAEGIAARLTEG